MAGNDVQGGSGTPRSKATIADVARAAGVSLATVSRVMNQSDVVAPDTAARVREAAQELGYRPNLLARGLARGHSGLVGMLVPDLGNPYFHQTLTGFMSSAKTAGYATLVATSEEDPEDEAKLAHDLINRTDGVFLCSPRMKAEVLAELATLGHPIVVSNRDAHEVGKLPSVRMDWHAAASEVARHLLDLGHRRVVFLSGPRTSWANEQRRAAFRDIPDLEVIDVPCGAMLEDGRRAAAAAMAVRPTALITFNDVVALGAYAWLHEQNVRIPHDVSVVGFDDIIFSRYVTPPLTTIRNGATDTGRAAWDLLSQVIVGESAATTSVILDASLVTRESTGPARA